MNCLYCQKELIITDTQEYELDDTYDFITYFIVQNVKQM